MITPPREELYEGGTLGDLLVEALERYPERTAFEDERGESLTYSDLSDLIGHAIAIFRRLGLSHGDAVVQLSGNRPETFAVMAAAYLIGLRSTTLNALSGVEDQRFIIADTGAKVVIVDTAYSKTVSALITERKVGWLSHSDGLPGVENFWSVADKTDRAALTVEARSGDVVRVAYTGGTTGRPKGVMLSHRSLVTQAVGTMIACRGVDDQRFLCAAPISHAAGALIVPVLASGGTIILQQGFEPRRFLQALTRRRATMTMLVPTMIAALLDHPDLEQNRHEFARANPVWCRAHGDRSQSNRRLGPLDPFSPKATAKARHPAQSYFSTGTIIAILILPCWPRLGGPTLA